MKTDQATASDVPANARREQAQRLRRAFHEAADMSLAFASSEQEMFAVARFVDLACRTLGAGGRVMTCGNGGSMSEAMHFAQECVGRFRSDRAPLPAMALSDPAAITCIANDFGFKEVFARQVRAHGGTGDLLVLFSTSGHSPNILEAARVGRELGVKTVGLTGHGGGDLAKEVDVSIVVPHASTADRIQEIHLQITHAVVESIELRLFPENDT